MLQNIYLVRSLLSMELNGIGMVRLDLHADNRLNITDAIPYPDIVLHSSPEPNVTGKRNSKL
jgi:hypothetical protein